VITAIGDFGIKGRGHGPGAFLVFYQFFFVNAQEISKNNYTRLEKLIDEM